MTDGDDKLRARYREIGREEPPAALDAAIKAAASRAIARPSFSQRWAIPVSIAAVLFLAVGVTLRMQQEQPGIETAMPTSEYPVPSSTAPAVEEKAKVAPPVQPAPQPKADIAPPAPRDPVEVPPVAQNKLEAATPPSPRARPQAMRDALPPPDRADAAQAEPRTRPEGFALQKRATDAIAPGTDVTAQAPAPAAPAPQAFPQAPATAQPPPLSERSASAVPAEAPVSATPAPAAPPPVAAAQSAAQRAKRESLGALADASRELADPRERELERIARLRVDGRDAEADAALERFRRENPEYRIPQAMLERVQRRDGPRNRGTP